MPEAKNTSGFGANACNAFYEVKVIVKDSAFFAKKSLNRMLTSGADIAYKVYENAAEHSWRNVCIFSKKKPDNHPHIK